MPEQLIVWMNGRRVGVWGQSRGNGSFQYDPTWAEAADRRVLSLSLPFTPGNEPHRGSVVTDYFDNLLPDSVPIRTRLQTRYSTGSADTYDLLRAIGRDCVGAVQLLPDGEEPTGFDRIATEPLDEAGVERAISAALTGGRVLGQVEEEEFRISIAGAQEKTALLRHNGQWCLPRGSTPTTHIFKLPLGLVGNLQADMKDSVENEWLCLKIMRTFGLDVAEAEIGQFGERKVLIVERFDRVWVGKRWVARRPQEDFCQALGLPGQRKYEGDGGPGMGAILGVLAAGAQAEKDRPDFVRAQLIFWLLAATDGHAKNFSIFHEPGGRYRLTPFYDVLSAWPIIGPGSGHLAWQKAKLAMAVRGKNAHWKLKDIRSRHWDGVAKEAGLAGARELIAQVHGQVPAALEQIAQILPKGFPARISDRILEGIAAQAKQLEE